MRPEQILGVVVPLCGLIIVGVGILINEIKKAL